MTAPTDLLARERRVPTPLVGLTTERRFRLSGSSLIYPLVIVLGAVLLYAPALVTRRLTLPLDILGFFYPWSEQATEIFPQGQGLPQNGLIQDVLTLTVPWFEFAWQEVRAGRLPLWNPYQLAGMPFIANDESAFFYPLQLLALLLPLSAGLQVELMVGTVVVGLGMYLYLRSIGLRRVAACVGGLTFMLSGFFVVWMAYPQAASATWLPWVLLCCEHILQRRGRLAVWIGALALAVGFCLFAGHIQVGLQVLMATGIYCGCRIAGVAWLHRRRSGSLARLAQSAVCIGLGIGLGVCVAAVQLLPTAQYLSWSYTAVYRDQTPSERPQPVSNLASWLVPNISGNNAYTRFFPSQQTLNGTYFNYNERTAYVGIGALLLAGLGLFHPRRRFRQLGLVFLTLGLVAGSVAYGFSLSYRLAVHFPILHSVNYNRVIFVVAFALASLAAIGFDALLIRAGRRASRSGSWLDGRQLVAGVALIGAVILVIGAVSLSTEQIAQIVDAVGGEPVGSVAAWVRGWTLWALILLVTSVGLIGGLLTRRLEPRLGAMALATLMVADLLVVADHYAPYNSPSSMYPDVTFTRELQSLGPGARFVVGQSGERQPVFLANSGTVYGVRDLNVYEAIIALRGRGFMDALNRLGPNRNQPTVLVANYAPDYQLLAVTGITHVVLPTDDAEPPGYSSHLVLQLESSVITAEAPLPALRTGETLAQTFMAPTDDLNGVGVYVDSNAPGATLDVTLRTPAGAEVARDQVSLPADASKGWVIASFPPVAHSGGQPYTLTLALEPGAPAPTVVQVVADLGALVPGWTLARNDQPISGTLRLRLYRSVESDGLTPVWSDVSHSIYQIAAARPRVYVADGVMSVPDMASALLATENLTSSAEVVVEQADGITSHGGLSTVLSNVPGEMVVDVSLNTAGLVVFNESFADGGWQAEVDGASQPVLHVNYLVQGVQVPAGEHRVRFHYWPASVTFGMIVSGLALSSIIVLVFAPRLARRRGVSSSN